METLTWQKIRNGYYFATTAKLTFIAKVVDMTRPGKSKNVCWNVEIRNTEGVQLQSATFETLTESKERAAQWSNNITEGNEPYGGWNTNLWNDHADGGDAANEKFFANLKTA